jgi:hypothetical protein
MSTTLAPRSANPMPDTHGLLSGHAYFLHWGVIQISLTNFIIIALMLVIFALALVLPFPHGRHSQDEGSQDEH